MALSWVAALRRVWRRFNDKRQAHQSGSSVAISIPDDSGSGAKALLLRNVHRRSDLQPPEQLVRRSVDLLPAVLCRTLGNEDRPADSSPFAHSFKASNPIRPDEVHPD